MPAWRTTAAANIYIATLLNEGTALGGRLDDCQSVDVSCSKSDLTNAVRSD